jgi:hypothetical protein
MDLRETDISSYGYDMAESRFWTRTIHVTQRREVNVNKREDKTYTNINFLQRSQFQAITHIFHITTTHHGQLFIFI